MNSFRKTHHFLLRQWERCIDDIELREILKIMPQEITQKTHVFVSSTFLKRLNLKAMPTSVLVIVVGKKNTLITLFLVDDFLAYIQSATIQSTLFI